jgi:alkanesulfonate monooxygenase SsuD/methylene tetrahydromethanopterin reductase-like flavin-dependent oxidoreductase (luciferase family)
VPPAPPPKPAPDPIIYPRGGQSPEQTEADRQACNRWATTQPSAMADASVFQRAMAACLDGRGYTVR